MVVKGALDCKGHHVKDSMSHRIYVQHFVVFCLVVVLLSITHGIKWFICLYILQGCMHAHVSWMYSISVIHSSTQLSHSLKRKYGQFDNFVVNGGTVSCHYDNLWCHQWRQSCQLDDFLLSVNDIPTNDRWRAFWRRLNAEHVLLTNFLMTPRWIAELQSV